MAVLDAILPVVSRSSSLALELYRVAAENQEDAKGSVKLASAINNFALILKQVGTIIKEDDRLPSHEAIKTLEDVIKQSRSVLAEVETAASIQHDEQDDGRDSACFLSEDPTTRARLEYLGAHVEAMRTTLSVLLQTLYTAQSIMWSKLRNTISPQQATRAVASERVQLETLIIEQQMSILNATKLHEQAPRPDSRTLMEADSSQSLIATEYGYMPTAAHLYPYRLKSISSLDTSTSTEAEWLLAVCSCTASHSSHLLEEWSSLPQFDNRLRDAEREVRKQKQGNQQPTVESEDEDHDRPSKLTGDGARRTHQRSGNVQPLFSDANSLAISVPEKYGPTAPPSPEVSPRNSSNSLTKPVNEQYASASPRSSIGSLPVEAAAAVEAQEEDDDIDLEIPWTLCTRKYYWKYVDAKQVGTNTDQPPSLAFLERNSWTEIMASWVCKEAIKEAGHRVTQVQKERKNGKRAKFETCFRVEKPLQFDQVKQLVERTVDIYRRTSPPSPPAQVRRSSFQRPPPLKTQKSSVIDRDRTPVPRNTHPPFERSNSSMHFAPPPMPPPLDRSLSLPGPGLVPPTQHPGLLPRASNFQTPMRPGPYASQPPPRAQSPWLAPYPPQAYSYSPQTMNHNSPQFSYPPNPQFSNPALPPHRQGQSGFAVPQSPLRQSYLNNPTSSSRYDDQTTSDSESGERERPRRPPSKSRSRYAPERKKKGHKTSMAVGTLMGVGGLTALLDGLSGL